MSEGDLTPFFRFFPQQAERETRVLTVRGYPGLPDDDYGLLESFCTDPACACRRVMLNVVSRRQQAILATVSFGFDHGEPLAGPFLDPLNPQSEYADILFALVEEILEDSAYVARLEAHYYQVKGATADPSRRSHRPPAQSSDRVRAKTTHLASKRRKRKPR